MKKFELHRICSTLKLRCRTHTRFQLRNLKSVIMDRSQLPQENV